MKFFAIVALVLFATADATSPVWTSASRTNIMTGQAGGNLVVVMAPTTAAVATNVITLTATSQIFTADDTSTTCTCTVATGTAPTFTTAVSGTGTVIALTLVGQGIGAGVATTITCTNNMPVNGAAALVVTFGLVTTTDATALSAQVGWTLTEKMVGWTSASRTSYVTGAAGGDLVVILTPLTACVATDTVTLTASSKIFTTDGTTTTCTVAPATGTAPTATTLVSLTGTKIVLTLVGQGLGAGVATTITCTNNLDVNGAAATAITFSALTNKDVGPLAGQTGYTIAAASSASSTASVSMLTMLALAGVAMRQ